MENVLYIFARVVQLTISVVMFAMLAEIILSLFTNPEESKLCTFLAFITEPFVAPVRFLLERFNLLQDSPIDWAFSLTYLILALVELFLPAI